MASTRAQIATLRKELGLRNEATVPDSVFEREIATGRSEISEEVRQRLNNGAMLDFNGAETEALEYFVKIRVTAAVSNGKTGRGKNGRVPATVSEVRRTEFGDKNLDFWRDRMVSAIGRIK